MRAMAQGGRLRSRVVASVAAVIVGVALLTGCGPVNAGTTAADQFDRHFAEVDGVEEVYSGGHNNLPFTGSVEVTVHAESGLSDERIDALAAEITEYMRTDTSNVSWYGSLRTERFTVGVTSDDAATTKNIDLARSLSLEPHVVDAEVGVPYSDEAVLVTVDEPEALTPGYLLAAAAAERLGYEHGGSGATAVTASADPDDSADFRISDEAYGGETTDIGTALAVYEIIRSAFPLIAAEVTPGEIFVRAVSEEQVPALEAFVAGIPAAEALTVDVQGGRSTSTNASSAAKAVSDALVDVEGVVIIKTEDAFVNITVVSAADAEDVLAAVTAVPEFTEIDGIGVSTATRDFSVFDDPAGFADSLAIAQAGYALPALDEVEVRDSDTPGQQPTAMFRFTSGDEKTISTFATTMKPHLTARGWHTFIAADGNVEWFIAADPLVLDDPLATGRDAEDQAFADMLVRLWDAVPG